MPHVHVRLLRQKFKDHHVSTLCVRGFCNRQWVLRELNWYWGNRIGAVYISRQLVRKSMIYKEITLLPKKLVMNKKVAVLFALHFQGPPFLASCLHNLNTCVGLGGIRISSRLVIMT